MFTPGLILFFTTLRVLYQIISLQRLIVSSDTHFQEEEYEAMHNAEETKNSIINTLQRAVRRVQKIRSEQKYYRVRYEDIVWNITG